MFLFCSSHETVQSVRQVGGFFGDAFFQVLIELTQFPVELRGQVVGMGEDAAGVEHHGQRHQKDGQEHGVKEKVPHIGRDNAHIRQQSVWMNHVEGDYAPKQKDGPPVPLPAGIDDQGEAGLQHGLAQSEMDTGEIFKQGGWKQGLEGGEAPQGQPDLLLQAEPLP